MWCSGDWFLHHDNAPAHTAFSVQQFLAKKHDGYPSSSLFTRPCTMQLLPVPRVKRQMKGKRFADVSEVKKKTLEVLNNISTEEFQKCFQQWEKHWYKCIELKGEYSEGDRSCNNKT